MISNLVEGCFDPGLEGRNRPSGASRHGVEGHALAVAQGEGFAFVGGETIHRLSNLPAARRFILGVLQPCDRSGGRIDRILKLFTLAAHASAPVFGGGEVAEAQKEVVAGVGDAVERWLATGAFDEGSTRFLHELLRLVLSHQPARDAQGEGAVAREEALPVHAPSFSREPSESQGAERRGDCAHPKTQENTMRTSLLLAACLALPASANDATISCGDPTKTGVVTVVVTLVNAQGKIKKVPWDASVPKSADEDQKASDIRSAAPPNSPYVTIGGTGSAVLASSKDGWTIVRVTMNTDTTGEKAAFNVFASTAADHHGVFGVSGMTAGHTDDGLLSQVTVEVAGALVVVPLTPGQSAAEVEDQVLQGLQAQGVMARLSTPEDFFETRYGLLDDGRSIVIEEIDGAGLATDCDDQLLDVDVTGLVDVTTPISIGVNYCIAEPTSTGTPASIVALGSPFVIDQNLTLRAYDLPTNKWGYFLASRDPGFIANPGGSAGNLCLGGQIGRYSGLVQNSGPSGLIEIEIDPLVVPMAPPTTILPGETWRFQCWFRDIDVAPTSNFTDGIWIEWQ